MATSRSTPLVLLKLGTDDPPLFVFPGLGGTASGLARFAESMQCKHPVYGVQPRGWDGTEPPLDSVEDMARYYLAAIKDRQPKGPYLLVGYSFGGLVALEIARVLMASGEEPAFLACLDPYIHPQYWPMATRIGVRAELAARRMVTLARSPQSAITAYVAKRAKRTPGNAVAGNIAGRPVDQTLPAAMQRVDECSLIAKARYKPHPYPARIVFFKPRLRRNLPSNPTGVWRNLAREFELQAVAGDHVSMIGSDCDDLAARLCLCIRMYLAKSSSDRVPPPAPGGDGAHSGLVQGGHTMPNGNS